MAHRNRLGAIVIDCHAQDLDDAARFWADALGGEAETGGVKDPRYREILSAAGPQVLVQAVKHDPRVHLDIETDDREAEVARLTAEGAREVERLKDWIVMEAPTGHRFCVIKPQGPGLAENGHEWRDDANGEG